jgi:SAM-dependent methyltransferase
MNNDFLNEINNLTEIGESRLKFLNKMYSHFNSLNRPINILETGTGHVANNGTFASNTYIFSKMIKNMKGGRLTTVDINEDHLNKCKEITKDFSDIIDYKLGDSINILRNLNADFVKSLDLIILDSYDLFLFDPDPSAIHHLQELLSLYTKLNKNCLIAIDDNYLPGNWIAWNWDDGRSEIFETKDKLIGKGMYCNDFLIKNDWIRDPSVIFAGVNIFLYYHKSNFQSHF